jgi:hypothetical protein
MPLRALGYALSPSNQVILADQSVTSATKGDGCIYSNLEIFKFGMNLWLIIPCLIYLKNFKKYKQTLYPIVL